MKSQLDRRVRSALHTQNKQLTDFFGEASPLNIDAATFDLKKQTLQGYLQLDDVREHPLV
jgi:hypothetical protein